MKDVQSMLGVWDHLLDAITANSYDCLMAIKKNYREIKASCFTAEKLMVTQ